jgi:hypothetical protein
LWGTRVTLLTSNADLIEQLIRLVNHPETAVMYCSVVDSYSVANRGAYRIGDETGQLWVVSDRGAPRKGAHVTVKGTIREGFNFGGLGDRINLPAGLSGLVMVESSHKAGK